jgi:cell division protein FtsA
MEESKEKIVVGLDIGTTKVCAIVGRANQYGKVDILGMGKVASHGGVTRGVVSNIDKTVAAIHQAVKRSFRKIKCRYKTR